MEVTSISRSSAFHIKGIASLLHTCHASVRNDVELHKHERVLVIARKLTTSRRYTYEAIPLLRSAIVKTVVHCTE